MDDNFVKFESINKERAKDIADRYVKNKPGVTRAEIILTNKCQLKCAYCQLQLEESCNEVRVEHEVLKKTIIQWLESGCKFLHFTGGEATLCEKLPEYVEMASKYGAEVTLSTNGVNDVSLYENLVRRGVNCFHISLDTLDASVFDRQVGVPGSYEKVLKTIETITRLRDEENYRTRLVLNVCITPKTFDSLVDTTRFMLSLKPNDIKLIPIAQLKEKWEDYEEKYESGIKQQLMEMIPEGEGFNMLRSRVKFLIAKRFRRYNDKRTVPPCYLSQDERTIDPEGNYYGCYINYREGATPIGNIKEDSYQLQSEKLRKHMMNFTNSEICQKYCADITVMCNKYIDNIVHEQDDAICYDMGNVNVTRNTCGNKAYNLERMYEEGINVPSGKYIRSQFLKKCFIEDNIEAYKTIADRTNKYTYNTAIRQWIQGQNIPDALMELCEKIFNQYAGKTLIVRSSSDSEDDNNSSYAGMFLSVGDIKTVGDLAKAVRDVYGSKYSGMIDEADDIEMGVIVQEMVEPDIAGVAFSINPVSGKNEYVLNYNMGSCEQVVDGEAITEEIIDKGQPVSENLSECQLKTIIAHIEKIKGILDREVDMEVDMEWAFLNDQFYVLQARPVTTVHKNKIKGENIYVDATDVERLQQLDMAMIGNAHKRYMEKHYQIRKIALDNNIPFPEVGYLFYNRQSLDEAVFDELVPNAKVYKVVSEQQTRTIGRGEIIDYLKKVDLEKNEFGNEDNIVRIQVITLTEACGNCCMTENGHIFIEYMPGGFGGFLTGELPFSSYIIDASDSNYKIIERYNPSYSAKWVFDSDSNKFRKTSLDPFIYDLNQSVLLQIVEMLRNLSEKLENGRLEWEMENDKVYLNDISFENKEIKSLTLSRNVLSPGKMSGEIRIIENINDIKDVLKGRSIIAESDFYEALRSDKLKEFKEKHDMKEGEKYIIVAQYAHPSFSLLFDNAGGFVFERGGMLSHLAILLRENAIPGRIQEGALEIYTNNQLVMEGKDE